MSYKAEHLDFFVSRPIISHFKQLTDTTTALYFLLQTKLFKKQRIEETPGISF